MKAKCEEAGVIFCRDQLEYPGDGFQYLCNILDTGFLSTVEGMKWQNDFINGDATVAGTPEMMESLQLLERRRNLGMLNGDGTPDEDNATRMPYLSEDGNQNVFVLNVSRYVGLNKDLGENEKKLKSVRLQPAAGSYVKKNSMQITQSRDLFLYKTLGRTEKPKSEDRSGGSSTHSSSSGKTHGGGGGKF